MGDTRIHNSGGTRQEDPGAGRGPARGGAGRFRAAHRVGDVVRGLVIRLEEETGTGWIDLEGERLLARLPETGPRPLPGETVWGRIEALHPEISLRLIIQDNENAKCPPPSVLASLYTTARERLDTLALRELWPAWNALPRGGKLPALAAYCRFMAGNEAALVAYAETQRCAAAFARSCAGAGVSAFRHLPWLLPGARSVEAAMLQKGRESRILAGAFLSPDRHVCLDGLLLPGSQRGGAVFRLLVADRGEEAALPRAADLSMKSWRCLSVERAETGATDIVALLLAACAEAAAGARQGGFTRKA